MVEDAAILCGLSLIYLAMLATIIALGRTLAAEDNATGAERP